jgi:hypothetical protein
MPFRCAPGAPLASRALNELFYQYRPRNRAVPDEVAASLSVLDGQLDREIATYANVLAAEQDEKPRRPTPPKRSSTLPAAESTLVQPAVQFITDTLDGETASLNGGQQTP